MRGDTRSKLLVVTLLAGGVLGGLCLAKPKGPQAVPVETASSDGRAAPRDLLNRIWFDKLPEKRSDEVTIAIFFGGGIGVFDTGSAYRASFEMFEFERKANELDFLLLHDKKRASVKYTVSDCDDKPPFDLCLVLDGNPRGPKKLYGFAYDDDEAAKVPWSRDLREAARARVRTR
jgi:hypothetical protein